MSLAAEGMGVIEELLRQGKRSTGHRSTAHLRSHPSHLLPQVLLETLSLPYSQGYAKSKLNAVGAVLGLCDTVFSYLPPQDKKFNEPPPAPELQLRMPGHKSQEPAKAGLITDISQHPDALEDLTLLPAETLHRDLWDSVICLSSALVPQLAQVALCDRPNSPPAEGETGVVSIQPTALTASAAEACILLMKASCLVALQDPVRSSSIWHLLPSLIDVLRLVQKWFAALEHRWLYIAAVKDLCDLCSDTMSKDTSARERVARRKQQAERDGLEVGSDITLAEDSLDNQRVPLLAQLSASLGSVIGLRHTWPTAKLQGTKTKKIKALHVQVHGLMMGRMGSSGLSEAGEILARVITRNVCLLLGEVTDKTLRNSLAADPTLLPLLQEMFMATVHSTEQVVQSLGVAALKRTVACTGALNSEAAAKQVATLLPLLDQGDTAAAAVIQFITITLVQFPAITLPDVYVRMRAESEQTRINMVKLLKQALPHLEDREVRCEMQQQLAQSLSDSSLTVRNIAAEAFTLLDPVLATGKLCEMVGKGSQPAEAALGQVIMSYPTQAMSSLLDCLKSDRGGQNCRDRVLLLLPRWSKALLGTDGKLPLIMESAARKVLAAPEDTLPVTVFSSLATGAHPHHCGNKVLGLIYKQMLKQTPLSEKLLQDDGPESCEVVRTLLFARLSPLLLLKSLPKEALSPITPSGSSLRSVPGDDTDSEEEGQEASPPLTFEEKLWDLLQERIYRVYEYEQVSKLAAEVAAKLPVEVILPALLRRIKAVLPRDRQERDEGELVDQDRNLMTSDEGHNEASIEACATRSVFAVVHTLTQHGQAVEPWLGKLLEVLFKVLLLDVGNDNNHPLIKVQGACLDCVSAMVDVSAQLGQLPAAPDKRPLIAEVTPASPELHQVPSTEPAPLPIGAIEAAGAVRLKGVLQVAVESGVLGKLSGDPSIYSMLPPSPGELPPISVRICLVNALVRVARVVPTELIPALAAAHNLGYSCLHSAGQDQELPQTRVGCLQVLFALIVRGRSLHCMRSSHLVDTTLKCVRSDEHEQVRLAAVKLMMAVVTMPEVNELNSCALTHLFTAFII
ncbi:unnamed protein product [Chrysoparadoxa australica]